MGREMHWLRVDLYHHGPLDDPKLYFQPVPCMHCEKAPCEMGCPVHATVHSPDGLNQMVYNRCIGTRTCSSFCPYKVRRFNWYDYRAASSSATHAVHNPDVTVRSRGVMEKCTYCTQRIQAAQVAADKEDRQVRDGEVVTACQQACPTSAIVFGNLNDPDSAVAKGRRSGRHYVLLEELGTRPRTTYLARQNDAPGSDAS
jgi:molybdopterin-containing oxidoreductase family iron-sulfur binding subunit